MVRIHADCSQRRPTPRNSSFIFPPLSHVDPANRSCILSILHYISVQCKSEITTPTTTFDHIIFIFKSSIHCRKRAQSQRNQMCKSGGFNTLMGFLGSIGYDMDEPRFQELLQEVVLSSSTFTHIMPGKTFTRALPAPCLITSAFYAVFLKCSLKSNEPAIGNCTFLRTENCFHTSLPLAFHFI